MEEPYIGIKTKTYMYKLLIIRKLSAVERLYGSETGVDFRVRLTSLVNSILHVARQKDGQKMPSLKGGVAC